MKIKLPFDCFVLIVIVIVIVVLLYHIYAWKSGRQSLLHKASSLVSEPLFLC